MNHRAVFRVLGVVLLFVAASQLVPLAVAIGFGETSATVAFGGSALMTAAIGALFAFGLRGGSADTEERPRLYRREGLAVVGLTWTACGLLGALPYLFLGTFPSWIDAVFESVSGFTTTGSTAMEPATIDGMPNALAIWRSLSQWLGGFGAVVVFVALFPTGGRSLYRSDAPGIRPGGYGRMRESTIALLSVYLGLSAILAVTLVLVGLSGMDACVHTFSTISTGGFSNHARSIAHFDSAAVEAVLAAFMLLAALYFALYESVLRAGVKSAWMKFANSFEAKLFLAVVVVATLSTTFVLWVSSGSEASLARALRDSFFQVVSIATTTGYTTADFDAWPPVGRMTLAALALAGTCAGSAGGGLKLVRVAIVVKAALVGVRRFVRPRVLHRVRMDGQPLDEAAVSSVSGFVILWIGVALAATGIVASFGIDLETSASAVVAALSNVGPGLGAVGPCCTYGDLAATPKLVLALCMILGRLEFYAFLVLVMPSAWRR